MDFFITNEGDRPDLAAVEVNEPEGFIGTKLMPIVNTADKSGTIYYHALVADAAAQTGRVAGAAPTSTQISNSTTTFTCAEAIKRGSITDDEMKQCGGVDKGEMIAAKFAKRQVARAIETSIAALILDSGVAASAAFDADKLLTQVQTALQAIRLYAGKTTLVTSTFTFKTMVQSVIQSTVLGGVFSRLITGSAPSVAVQGMSLDAWKNAMGMFLGVDQVMLGDDGIWNATAIAGRFAIGKYNAGTDPLFYKGEAVYGATWLYLPDGTQVPYQMQAIPDRLNHNNHVDCKAWYKEIELNSGAQYVFDGVQ